MRIRRQRCTGFFEHGDGLFPGDGREVIEKDFQRVTRFEMVEQRLDRNARPGEDRRAAVDLGVDGDRMRLDGGIG